MRKLHPISGSRKLEARETRYFPMPDIGFGFSIFFLFFVHLLNRLPSSSFKLKLIYYHEQMSVTWSLRWPGM